LQSGFIGVMYTAIFSRGADGDLNDIEEYLAVRFSEANARQYIQRVISFCQGLANAPQRGTRRDDIRQGLRTIGFERRVTVAFEVVERRVVILGILYGGRQFEREL
jgi:toxin ParE1/3/4